MPEWAGIVARALSLAAVKVSILLLAAGRGSRLAAEVPKAFVDCGGQTLLMRSLRRLARIPVSKEIILTVRPEDRQPHLSSMLEMLEELGLDQVVDGGDTRLQSMRLAFDASSHDHPLVLVHDAARPFFSVTAAQQAIEQAAEVGAALLAIPAPDTLKRVRDGRILQTVDRRDIHLAQTPQVLRRDLLAEALAKAESDGFECSDDVSLFEHAGFPVALVPGSPANFKITTKGDLELATLIASREDS